MAQKFSKRARKLAISSQNAKIYTSKYLRNKWSDERSLWESSSDNERHFVGGLPLPQSKIKHGWWPPYWKSIWRHITALGGPIWTKFGSLMQNNTPITAKWSRSKPELQFQYGGRLFFQTRSSNISAVNGDMSTKFCLLIDFDLLKALTSTNTKREIVLSGGGCHVAKSLWLYITVVSARFGRNWAAWCRITHQLWRSGRDRNRKWYSNMADVCFCKPEVIISQPWIDICRQNFVCW